MNNMFLASKIALGYLGYLSIKNKNTKELSKKQSKKDNIDKNDYDTTINEILQKKKKIMKFMFLKNIK